MMTTISATVSDALYVLCANWSRYPSPRLDATNSPTTAPVKAKPTAIFRGRR
jgi:hypothetical protein